MQDSQAVAGGVIVQGPYTEADVAAALALVRAQTTGWIYTVNPPQDQLIGFQCGEINDEELPANQMEATTAVDRDFIHSSGTLYLLRKRRGVWAVRDSSEWFSGH